MRIDLHGYRPSEIVWNGRLIEIVRQCWEMGETELELIHGHGRARGKTPGFYNTKTGVFGLAIRPHPSQQEKAATMDQVYDAGLPAVGCDQGQAEAEPGAQPDQPRSRPVRRPQPPAGMSTRSPAPQSRSPRAA